MANSRYELAYIDYYGQTRQQRELQEDEFETMRALFRALSPIHHSRPGSIETPDYSLNYLGGMDPTQLDVRISEGRLEFGLGFFIHTGGDAKKFLELLPNPPSEKP